MASRATNYEKQKAKQHGAKHIGGPGKPDYVRGSVTGEVKARKSPVTKPELERYVKKGVGEIDSKGGFTAPARERAKALKVKLFSRRRRVL